MPKLDSLPERTRLIFDLASRKEYLSPFTLVGGTALSLHIGHRQSLDLDFAVFARRLPTHAVNQWIAELKAESIPVVNIEDQSKATAFRINVGEDLSNYARDYEIAGVKVQFFANDKGKVLNDFYVQHSQSRPGFPYFSIMDIDGLKVSKTLILSDRVRSRDLFDVMTLMQQEGLTIDVMWDIVQKYESAHDFGHFTSVMRGEIPLDKDDEGLSPLNLKIDIDDIYTYFNEKIDRWERARASARRRNFTNDSGGPSP